VQARWVPIGAARDSFAGRVERAAEVHGAVVLVDLTDAPLDVAAKFVTYARYPECAYSVMLTRNKQHYKLSVGHNPWSGVPRVHDIAAICRRYDGGGHPAVGACSFPLNAQAPPPPRPPPPRRGPRPRGGARHRRGARRSPWGRPPSPRPGRSAPAMTLGFAREGRPLVVGHRGVRRPGIVENTLAAFAAAAREGAEAIE